MSIRIKSRRGEYNIASSAAASASASASASAAAASAAASHRGHVAVWHLPTTT